MTADFYASYRTFKRYEAPVLKAKAVCRYDRQIWRPARFVAGMSVLELGCGTGGFLLYLQARGLDRFVGVDADPNLAAVIPPALNGHFQCADAGAYLRAAPGPFDRIVLLDVLEHFTAADACALISLARDALAEDGRMVVRVPNAESPWGAKNQYGDLTHKTAFTKASLAQLADACGCRVEQAYGQRDGSPLKRATDAAVDGLLSWALLSPPDIWAANLYVIIAKAPSDRRRRAHWRR